tara:strand:+ start:112 stop:846 length:735 start_codon:yes stop_codon:yes gene_type:complete
MFQTEKQMNILDTIEKTKGGQYFAVIGHESKTDKSIKNRILQASTAAVTRKVDQDAQRLDGLTALDAAYWLSGYGIPADLASEALTILVDRVKARQSGTSQGGAKVKHVIARGANGRAILQIVSVKDEWALQAVGEQVEAYTVKPGIVDHKALNASRLQKNIEQAQKQAEKRKSNPKQSISSIVALLNKCIPVPSHIIQYRTLTLIGPNQAKVESIAINGHRHTDFLSVVAHFRPDLLPLVQSV